MPRNRRKMRGNKMLLMVRRLQARLDHLEVPRYRHKRSNHVYTQHQLLVLLVLRQYFGKSYRRFMEIMENCDGVLDELGLRTIPHFTTLHKCVSRIEEDLVHEVLASFLDLVDGAVEIIIDSTGFSCTSASHHYIMVLERNEGRLRLEKRPIRRHVKQTMLLDHRSQIVVAARYRLGPANDAPDAIPLLNELSKHATIAAVIGDKGYDSRAIRHFIWYALGAEAHIPLRAVPGGGGKRRHHRLRQAAEFDAVKYRRRCLVETGHSSIKRTMRSDVLARIEEQRRKELLLRAIAYDLGRDVVLMDGFY